MRATNAFPENTPREHAQLPRVDDSAARQGQRQPFPMPIAMRRRSALRSCGSAPTLAVLGSVIFCWLLQEIGFLNPENPDHWMIHIRRFLSRTKLQSREVKIIRGICRQLEWQRGKSKKNS